MDRRTAVGHEASGITPAARPWQCRHVYLCAARPQNTAGPLGQSGAACRAACKAQPAHFVVKGSCIAQRFQPVSRCFAFPGPAARTRPDIPVMITAAAASGSVTPVGESRAGPSCGGTKGWGCAAAAEAALVHRAVPFRSPRASLSAAAGRAVAAMLLRAAGCWRAAASRPGPVWLRGAEHRGLPLASRRLGLPLPLPLAAGGRRLRSGCGALPEVRWEGKGLGLAALCFARNTNVTGRLGRHIWFLVFAWHEVCYGMVVSDWGSER